MNYSEIISASYAIADREDNTEAYALRDTFLRLVESRIDRQLRRMEMTERATILTTAEQEYYGLPSRFNGIVDIEMRDSLTARRRYSLERVSHAQLNQYAVDTDVNSGLETVYYNITANQLQIMPPQNGKVIEMIYWRKLLPLNSSDNSNWVSDSFPDIYINGMIVEISKFVKDWDSVANWDNQFLTAIDAANQNNEKVRWSAASLTTRLG